MNRCKGARVRWCAGVLVLLVLLVPGARVRAQAANPVTIDQLVGDALQRSPVILAAQARMDASTGEALQAGLRANPELMTSRRDEWGGMNAQTTLGVRVPLELGRRDARVAVGDKEVDRAAASVDEARRAVAASVRLAAIRALTADRMIAINADLVKSRRDWRDVLSARVAAGLSAPVDRDAAEVDLRLADAELTRARAAAAARWAELKAAAGLDPGTPLALAGTLESLVRDIRRTPPAGAEIDAPEARPDVREADAAIAAAAARERLARRDGRLDLSLDATYMRTTAGFPQLGFSATGAHEPILNRMNEVMFGATVMLPWRNRNQGAIAAAAAERRAAASDRDERLLAARAEIVAARARDLEAGHALDIWADGVLDLAARNLSVARQSYEIGRVTRFEVLAEERRYLDLQAAYVAALTEGYEARVVLTQSLGGSR
ncbi:MAG: TolC family protein [Acidobacteria bacterium]|nr:MAG: TolC family protein [Acidobacteriota bacterium]